MAKKRSVIPNGDAVRHARLAKGWRPEDLAREADCSLRTIENVERSTSVYANTLASIAVALGADFQSLLAKPPGASHRNGSLRSKARIIIGGQEGDSLDVKPLIASLIEDVPFVDEVVLGTSRFGHFPVAPDGGFVINLTMTCRDARALKERLLSGEVEIKDFRAFHATDCWITVCARPLVEPD